MLHPDHQRFRFSSGLVASCLAGGSTNYGRATSVAALAMESRVLLTAASPLFNKDWDNPGSPKWQAALAAGLKAEIALTAAGYGLYGSTAKEWAEMSYVNDNAFNREAIIVQLLSNTSTSSVGYNNSWENTVRPKEHNGVWRNFGS
jgi:L-fucose isomerase-like protein